MGWLSKFFGKSAEKSGNNKTKSTEETSVREVKINKDYAKLAASISTDPETELDYKGPQVFVSMKSRNDCLAVAKNLPQQVKDMLSEAPEVIDFNDGESAIHLCFDDKANIRKSVDRLFNGNHGADLGDYGLTKLDVEGFITVDLPDYDSEYLVGTYSSTGQAVTMGRVAFWT